MKHFKLTFLLTVLMSMVGAKTLAWDAKVGGIYYNFSNSKATVTYYTSFKNSSAGYSEYQGVINIPEYVSWSGKIFDVTAIDATAFSYCTGLTSISIPNSVVSIGSGAFEGCSRLTSISIPSSIEHVGWDAFSGTAWYDKQPDGLVYVGKVAYRYKGYNPNKNVNIKYGIVEISDYAFSQSSELTTIDIPFSVKIIGEWAFWDCSSLTSIDIPFSVTSIGYNAFYRCNNLQKVIVANLASWCKISFYNAEANPLYYAKHLYSNDKTEITNLVIPNGVAGIGRYAFYNCSSLTSLTIPDGVTSIGSNAFSGCSSISAVISNIETPNSFSNSCFPTSVYSNATLYVPCGTKDVYKNTEGWKEFQNIKEMESTGVIKINNEEEKPISIGHYSIDGKLLVQPVKGINIIKMSDGQTKKVVVK